MILGFLLVDMNCHTDTFVNVESSLHHRDESHLVTMDNPSNVLLDPISKDLVENYGKPKRIHPKLLEVIEQFSNVVGYKIDALK